MRYEFHAEALEEYTEAALYYASVQPGLELRFISCVEDAVHRVLEAPKRWRIYDVDVRMCLTHVFPYAVLYTIEADYILILAVTHCHREPRYWRRRQPHKP